MPPAMNHSPHGCRKPRRHPPKATKWKKGKAGKAGAKPKGKAVTAKIRKPKKR
jgi:hypothetical protein